MYRRLTNILASHRHLVSPRTLIIISLCFVLVIVFFFFFLFFSNFRFLLLLLLPLAHCQHKYRLQNSYATKIKYSKHVFRQFSLVSSRLVFFPHFSSSSPFCINIIIINNLKLTLKQHFDNSCVFSSFSFILIKANRAGLLVSFAKCIFATSSPLTDNHHQTRWIDQQSLSSSLFILSSSSSSWVFRCILSLLFESRCAPKKVVPFPEAYILYVCSKRRQQYLASSSSSSPLSATTTTTEAPATVVPTITAIIKPIYMLKSCCSFYFVHMICLEYTTFIYIDMWQGCFLLSSFLLLCCSCFLPSDSGPRT